MRLKQFLRLVHPGVNRVFSASRRAGGIPMAIRSVFESAAALVIAMRVSSLRTERQNAIRHFIWQARLTMARSERFAAEVGDLHEVGSPDPVDSAVDQRNNAVGREYATEHAHELAHLPALTALSQLTDAAVRYWSEGRLWRKGDGFPVPSDTHSDV